jgi:3-dehydroquinate synthase II/3-amino-4-hydroxybenzoic acid synthase
MSDQGPLVPVWADLTAATDNLAGLLTAALQSSLSGVVLRPDQVPAEALPDRLRLVVIVEDEGGYDDVAARGATLIFRNHAAVAGTTGTGKRGVWIDIADGAAMRRAVDLLPTIDVLLVSFADTTNIPLELILAEAQSIGTTVVKKVDSLSDALVTRGVLQQGPDAMMLRVDSAADVAEVTRALLEGRVERMELAPARVLSVRSIGMGMRGCVDTAALFEPDEGIVVGSTSAGGLVVCAEVHYLPYMNLRPFRVNAGAVHSYVWAPSGRTSYITDLAAGESVLAVASSGRARPVLVGRVKTELRPLRLISCLLGDAVINTIVQDDWHVRLFDAEGKVRNATEIVPGDHMLALPATPGRHVGIPVSESIVEV